VQHKLIHLIPQAAGIALAFLLLVPATADGAPSGSQRPAHAVRYRASFGGDNANAVRSSMRVVGIGDAAGRPGDQRPGRTSAGRGLGWREAAIGTGILVGIVLLGLWGDVVVGTIVVAVDALVGAAAALSARGPRGARHYPQSTGSAPAGGLVDNPQ
jgi:hypothetical protein